ncbi:unnamed protein product [Prunus brigantina]
MLAQMPCTRIVVLYYTEVGNSNTVWSQASFGCQVKVLVHEGIEPTMNGNNEGPTFEALGEVSSDGEHSSDFNTQSEGDGDDMEWDNEGTSKVRRKKKTYLGLSTFQGEVLESYHVRVSKTQVYKAKRLAKAQIEGNYIQQYARLWDYTEQLKNTNKGSPYPGQILTAAGVDGNNSLFPISYVVAEIENKDSWIWFQHILVSLLNTCCGATAKATTIPWWEVEMKKMKEDDLEAWKWLVMANRRAICGKWKHPIGPRIFKIIEKNKMGASQCIPRLAGKKMYQLCLYVAQAKAAQNENACQNRVEAANNGNAGQNDIAPAQTNATPTQTYIAPTQIQVNRGRGTDRGRGRGRGSRKGRSANDILTTSALATTILFTYSRNHTP